MYDLVIVRILYRRLITLYPREFRERLGESTAQTFNDLYKEQHAKIGRFNFVLYGRSSRQPWES